MTPDEAKDKLWKAVVANEKGDILGAMRAVGMTFEWLEQMSMDEAIGVFGVRCADLRRISEGKNE